MSITLQTIGLLILSNVFMTIAWYAHLRDLSRYPWYTAAIASWGVALFEYLLQVPANRIGYQKLSLPQLKIIQEVVTLTVFVPFAIVYMRQPIRRDYLWAALCMLGAVYFVFRGETPAAEPAHDAQAPAQSRQIEEAEATRDRGAAESGPRDSSTE